MATIDSATHAVGAKTQRVIDTFDRYVVPNYKRFPVCLVKGEGSRMPRVRNTSTCSPAGAATCLATAQSLLSEPFRSRWRR